MCTTVAEKRAISSPYGMKSAPDVGVKKPPRLVLGLGGSPLAAAAAAALRARGWEVCIAATGEEGRRVAVRSRAHVLVLPVTAARLLHTAKLLTALPKRMRVVLVGERPEAALMRASAYLGAAFVAETNGVGALIEAVLAAN